MRQRAAASVSSASSDGVPVGWASPRSIWTIRKLNMSAARTVVLIVSPNLSLWQRQFEYLVLSVAERERRRDARQRFEVRRILPRIVAIIRQRADGCRIVAAGRQPCDRDRAVLAG